jgi:hypothetical protein
MGKESTALIVFGFGGLGVLLAFIVERLYTAGIVIDELLGPASTITELQAIIVVVFMLLGVVIAATR